MILKQIFNFWSKLEPQVALWTHRPPKISHETWMINEKLKETQRLVEKGYILKEGHQSLGDH